MRNVFHKPEWRQFRSCRTVCDVSFLILVFFARFRPRDLTADAQPASSLYPRCPLSSVDVAWNQATFEARYIQAKFASILGSQQRRFFHNTRSLRTESSGRLQRLLSPRSARQAAGAQHGVSAAVRPPGIAHFSPSLAHLRPVGAPRAESSDPP